jgi:putative selenate reductase
MAELSPLPLGALVRRAFRELDLRGSIFDLPVARARLASARDLSVRFHHHAPSSPLGPAAGPHTQMAQNLVLAWLAGCRVMELKTVQVRDDLVIPRPCIDMQTVGYNVEWSQELRLEQSLEEYVKAAMLIAILRASGRLPIAAGFERVVFDTSVGYDLAGIQSPRVQAFLDGLADATPVIDRLRRELPAEHARFRDVEVAPRISDTVTLSTFHGCPPDEIERIVEHLLADRGLACNVKLNPTLLGPARLRELLHDVMGYQDVVVPDGAFARDAQWAQVEGFVGRLRERAAGLGLGFGVKLTNTLIVENRRTFFPASEREMYLSGAPLHVLAMNLVQAMRRTFGAGLPISFSAGIDRGNVADAVALGLVPVTVCSDLLQPGGYARAAKYVDALEARMAEVGARSIDEYVVRAFGEGAAALAALDGVDGELRARCLAALTGGGSLAEAAGPALLARWAAAAAVRNTDVVVPLVTLDPRYAYAANKKPPRKLGTQLALFDCVSCGKCVPVCPNDANFTFVVPPRAQPIVKVRRDGDRWSARQDGTLEVAADVQYGNVAELCNECGNCDVFCPEDGGPHARKPRLFASALEWRRSPRLDGFAVEPLVGGGRRVFGRIDGREVSIEPAGDGRVRYRGDGFDLRLDPGDPLATLAGEADGEVDLTPCHLLGWLDLAVWGAGAVNYLGAMTADATPAEPAP